MDENSKISDISKLTEAELRILEVSLNPALVSKNVKEKCKIAEVSRDSWYRAFKNPEFVRCLNDGCLDMLKSRVSELVNATYKYAVKNPKNSQDRKVLLTMAGLYKEKTELSTDDKGLNVNNHVDFSNLSTDDIKELLKSEENSHSNE